jgi:uncharacterized DUF497 family protein
MYEFRWTEWNVEKVLRHNVSPDEAEYVVNHARSPYPEHRGDGKWAVWGRTWAGEYLQVVYLIDADGTVFVIHARPLEQAEKRRYRRRRR